MTFWQGANQIRFSSYLSGRVKAALFELLSESCVFRPSYKFRGYIHLLGKLRVVEERRNDDEKLMEEVLKSSEFASCP